MFANRFTAFVDACSLASVLKRNLLLSLAEAEFFRIRWSAEVLDEMQTALVRIWNSRQAGDGLERATRARASMESAFEEAGVNEYDDWLPACAGLPDPKDAHVLAAALKTQASTIVTENLKHFPSSILTPLNIDARTADQFIADTIDLDPGRAVAAIRCMRERFKLPAKTAFDILRDMDADGLRESVDLLRPHIRSL